MEAH
jgi:hypothetical protein